MIATPADIPRIISMGRKFHEASGQPSAYDEEAVEAMLAGMIDSEDGGLFIAEGGMIGGMIAPAYCDPNWRIAVELFWWSTGHTGVKLLKEFEDWAHSKGVNEIRMTTVSAFPAAEKIMDRRGYRVSEISHSKTI